MAVLLNSTNLYVYVLPCIILSIFRVKGLGFLSDLKAQCVNEGFGYCSSRTLRAVSLQCHDSNLSLVSVIAVNGFMMVHWLTPLYQHYQRGGKKKTKLELFPGWCQGLIYPAYWTLQPSNLAATVTYSIWLVIFLYYRPSSNSISNSHKFVPDLCLCSLIFPSFYLTPYKLGAFSYLLCLFFFPRIRSSYGLHCHWGICFINSHIVKERWGKKKEISHTCKKRFSNPLGFCF